MGNQVRSSCKEVYQNPQGHVTSRARKAVPVCGMDMQGARGTMSVERQSRQGERRGRRKEDGSSISLQRLACEEDLVSPRDPVDPSAPWGREAGAAGTGGCHCLRSLLLLLPPRAQ